MGAIYKPTNEVLPYSMIPYFMIISHRCSAVDKETSETMCALALFPGLSARGGPGTHCLCMLKIFRYIFRKKLCALPCSYAEPTKNTELTLNYRLQQRFNLQNPAGILLFRHGSIIFPNAQSNRKITNWLLKRPIGRHRIFIRLPLCSTSALNTIGFYSRNGTRYSVSNQQIAWSCIPLLGYSIL